MLRSVRISASSVGSGEDFFLGTGRFRCAIAASRSHTEGDLFAAFAAASTAAISALGSRVAIVLDAETGVSARAGSGKRGAGIRETVMGSGRMCLLPRYGGASNHVNSGQFRTEPTAFTIV